MASLRNTLFWSFFLQIFWSISDKNFNLVRPAVQFFPKKSHILCKNHNFFESCQNIGSFVSATKEMDTFLFEMSMKWMFTFKNFRNVYWHGTTHSAMCFYPTFKSYFRNCLFSLYSEGSATLKRSKTLRNTRWWKWNTEITETQYLLHSYS